LVRASDCGSEGRGFEPPRAPITKARRFLSRAFFIGRNPEQPIGRYNIQFPKPNRISADRLIVISPDHFRISVDRLFGYSPDQAVVMRLESRSGSRSRFKCLTKSLFYRIAR